MAHEACSKANNYYNNFVHKQQFEDIELFSQHYLTTPVIYVNMCGKTSVSNIVAIFGNPN